MKRNGLLIPLVAAALLVPGATHARWAASWGGSILVVDAASGTIVRNLPEPMMFNGVTYGPAEIEISRDKDGKTFRVTWDDVVEESNPTKTERDEMGVPKRRSARSLEFSLPDFSTRTVRGSISWSDAAVRPIPQKRVLIKLIEPELLKPRPHALQLPDDMDMPVSEAPDFTFVSRGEGVDAIENKTKRVVWSRDLNPKKLMLPGAPPQIAIFDLGDDVLIATDRLGLHRVTKKTGAEIWHLEYSNADVIPKIALGGDKLVIAPADIGPER
jgi:hypothetical protein